MLERELRKNLEGYSDPTAYKVITNIEREEYKSYDRFNKLLNTIFYICELAGFHVEGRIVLRDKSNGKLWK